jgi:hypothetical protein
MHAANASIVLPCTPRVFLHADHAHACAPAAGCRRAWWPALMPRRRLHTPRPASAGRWRAPHQSGPRAPVQRQRAAVVQGGGCPGGRQGSHGGTGSRRGAKGRGLAASCNSYARLSTASQSIPSSRLLPRTGPWQVAQASRQPRHPGLVTPGKHPVDFEGNLKPPAPARPAHLDAAVRRAYEALLAAGHLRIGLRVNVEPHALQALAHQAAHQGRVLPNAWRAGVGVGVEMGMGVGKAMGMGIGMGGWLGAEWFNKLTGPFNLAPTTAAPSQSPAPFSHPHPYLTPAPASTPAQASPAENTIASTWPPSAMVYAPMYLRTR